MTNPVDIESLRALGQLLEEQDIEFSAVVIGGANLIVHGIVDRVTEDVDVIARRAPDGRILPALPIPRDVEQAAQRVADLRGLAPDWFNAESSLIFGGRFPDGYQSRLSAQSFGGLIVWWVARENLVAFKLYANLKTIDQQPNRHRQDLERLELDQERITAAVEWITSLLPEGSRKLGTLAGIVKELGYEY